MMLKLFKQTRFSIDFEYLEIFFISDGIYKVIITFLIEKFQIVIFQFNLIKDHPLYTVALFRFVRQLECFDHNLKPFIFQLRKEQISLAVFCKLEKGRAT